MVRVNQNKPSNWQLSDGKLENSLKTGQHGKCSRLFKNMNDQHNERVHVYANDYNTQVNTYST